jgi:hypothetical protein
MKNLTTLSALLFLLPGIPFAQLVNNNATIVIESGAIVVSNIPIVNGNGGEMTVKGELHVSENLSNISGSTLNGNGEYFISGDWINEASFEAETSRVTFEGEGNSSVKAGGDVFFDVNLKKANGNLLLDDDLIVSNTLSFEEAGKVILNDHDMEVGEISGAGVDRYVQTNGEGALHQTVGSTAVDFPLGNSAYNPATLSNNGTSDLLSVRVKDEVLDGGDSGSAISSGMVNRSWIVGEAIAGGSSLNLILQWNGEEEESSFDRMEAGVFYNDGSGWEVDEGQVDAAGGSDPYTQDRAGIGGVGSFAIGDGCILTDLLTITDNPIPTNIYKADDLLVAEGIVTPGSDVTLISSNEVSLEPGFHAEFGSDFLAYIEACALSTFQNPESPEFRTEETAKTAEPAGKDTEVSNFHFIAYPNPFQNQTTLEYVLQQSGAVTLLVFDSQGALIQSILQDAYQEEGIYRAELDTSRLQAGTYVVIIQTPEGRKALNLVKAW